MKTIKLQPCQTTQDMDAMLGQYFQPNDTWTVYTADDDVCFCRDDDSTVIAKVIRNAVPEHLVNLAVDCYRKVGEMTSTNRGHAAGIQSRGKSDNNYEKGGAAHTGIFGYMDNTNLRRPCRLTKFSKDHFATYTKGLPFVRHVDSCFAQTMPHEHARQITHACVNDFHIEGTSFSTVTVNYNFRTALHKDSGDYRHGFGTLVVCQHGVEGGMLLFPRFKLALSLRSGDFVAMDVHEYHCNSELHVHPGGYRMSFVCYLRERMAKCEETNRTIERMNSRGSHTTHDWIRDIFGFYNEEVPTKIMTGKGAFGHEWWECVGERITLIYKNKRYTLLLNDTKTKIHELSRIWEHASKNASQSQGERG